MGDVIVWGAITAGVALWAWIRSKSGKNAPPPPAQPRRTAVTAVVNVEPAHRPPPATEPVVVSRNSEAPPTYHYASPPTRSPVGVPVAWIPAGTSVTIAGTSFDGGMVYVGDPILTPAYRDEPSVIDPTLAVDARRMWDTEWGASYWPRYSGLSPTDRARYLHWLSHGRADPAAPIGIPFIFYYGIERRLLEDARLDDTARAEVPRLIAEIDRLRRIYDHASFQQYAGTLRDLAIALYGNPSRFRVTSTLSPGDMPSGLVVVLGRLIDDGEALTPALAFDWARCLEDAPRPTAYRLVSSELEALFLARYAKQFPSGLKIPPPKRRLTLDYRGAAGNRTSMRLVLGLPDVRGITAPQKPLAKLLESCLDDLQPLVRVRKREKPTAVEMAAALPFELRAGAANDEGLQGLTALLDRALAGSPIGLLPLGDQLLAAGGVVAGERWGKRECTTLLVALEGLGIGIEPDVRFDGPVVDAAKPVALFRFAGEPIKAPTANYRMGQLLLQLAVAVATADGAADARELEEALQHMDRLFQLDAAERQRLQAHLRWLEAVPPSLGKLASKLKTLPPEPRRGLADVVVLIAAADGRVDPKEMRTLEKIYRALGLDAASLPGDIHRAMTGTAPRPATPTKVAGGLNADAIAQKLQETADVQRLLTSIFVDDASGTPPAPAAPAPSMGAVPSETHSVAGLDAAHSTLLHQLLQSATAVVDRAQLERWCEPLGLMPDGALESVNEAAFNVAGDALLDVDDEITIRPDIRDILNRTLQGAPA